MISQAHRCLGESFAIHFSPGTLAFTLETQQLTRIEYITIFEAEISIYLFLFIKTVYTLTKHTN